MKKILNKLKIVYKDGLAHIFSTTVLNKVIGMLTSIVIIRIFTKEEYGNFSYAYNIVATLISFSS